MNNYDIDERFYDKNDRAFGLASSALVGKFDPSYYVEEGFEQSITSVYFVCRVFPSIDKIIGGRENRWTRKRREFNIIESQASAYRKAHKSLKDTKDIYVLRIGSIDFETVVHSGAEGNNITYNELYTVLMNYEYDPLLPIRSEDVRNKVETDLSRIIRREMESGHGQSAINAVIEKYARELVEKVKEYIIGGNKPPLEKDTISRREYKRYDGIASYPGKAGIYEALTETGELAESISFNIIKSQSDELREMVEDFRKTEKEWERREKRTLNDKKRKLKANKNTERYDPKEIYNRVFQKIKAEAGPILLRKFSATFGKAKTLEDRAKMLDKIEKLYSEKEEFMSPENKANLKVIIDFRRAILNNIGKLVIR